MVEKYTYLFPQTTRMRATRVCEHVCMCMSVHVGTHVCKQACICTHISKRTCTHEYKLN